MANTIQPFHENPLSRCIQNVVLTKSGEYRTLAMGIARTSSLQAPIMLLLGHESEVYACRFHPSGQTLASSGQDKNIFLWNVKNDCENYAILKGHKKAVTDLAFSKNGDLMATSSADKTVAQWDYETGAKIKTFRQHMDIVNCCSHGGLGAGLTCSGSDDRTVKVWDQRFKHPVHDFKMEYQILTTTFDKTGLQVISAGIDNQIHIHDLRTQSEVLTLCGHTDSVTGLALSPDGNYVLSNSMDNTARMWSIAPFCMTERCLKIFTGHRHNFEKNLLRCQFLPNSKLIACGSSDCCLYIWDMVSTNLAYRLPGHEGSVNAVDFHPSEPIVLSAGSDRKIYLGELQEGF